MAGKVRSASSVALPVTGGVAKTGAGGAAIGPRHARLERTRAVLFRAAEAGFTVLLLFLFSNALVPLLLQYSGQAISDLQEGNTTLRTMFLLLKAGALLLGLRHWRDFVRVVFADKLTLALITIAVVSVFWSAAPQITLRRGGSLLGSACVSFYLASRYSVRSRLQLLSGALGIAAGLSFIFGAFLPAYGVDTGATAGAWHGVYVQKNVLGMVMALSTITFLLLWRDATHRRWVPFAGMGLSLALVLLSASMTSLLLVITLAALIPLYTAALRGQRTRLLAILCFVIALGGGGLTIAVANVETLVGAVGKDITLTGRTMIWSALLSSVMARPWLGFGYNAFWLGSSGESGRVMETIGFGTVYAHNGFLDVLADLGVVGLMVFGAGFTAAFARAWANARANQRLEGLWPLLFLTFVFLSNLTEGNILRPNAIFWILYVATVCGLGPARSAGREHRAGSGVVSPGVRRGFRRFVASHDRRVPIPPSGETGADASATTG